MSPTHGWQKREKKRNRIENKRQAENRKLGYFAFHKLWYFYCPCACVELLIFLCGNWPLQPNKKGKEKEKKQGSEAEPIAAAISSFQKMNDCVMKKK